MQSHRNKFDYRDKKYVFIGYKEGNKGFILCNLSTHDIFLYRNVVSYDSFFPFKYFDKLAPSNIVHYDLSNIVPHLDDILLHPNSAGLPNEPSVNDLSIPTNNFDSLTNQSIDFDNELTMPTHTLFESSNIDLVSDSPQHDLCISNVPLLAQLEPGQSLPTRHLTRIFHLPSYLENYLCL